MFDATDAPPPVDELVDVFEWNVEPVRMAEVVERLRQPSDTPRLAMTVNVALMWIAARDPAISRIVQDSTIRVADGMGVIWAWRALGRRLPERIAGIDLMVELIEAAAVDGRSIYLLGARHEVVDRLGEVLLQRFPTLHIAGSRDGYFTEAENADVVAAIRSADPDLLFLGMPSPMKEEFAARHLQEFGADLVMGVGGSFDVIAGYVHRAPSLLQKVGLEWAWRLACEPRRMWRRYLVTNAWVARQITLRTIHRLRQPTRPAVAPDRGALPPTTPRPGR